jgi:hypothetical protein
MFVKTCVRNFSIECAGFAATTQLCQDSAPPGSQIVLVGLSTENVTLDLLRFVRAELDVKGSMIYDHPLDTCATRNKHRAKRGSTYYLFDRLQWLRQIDSRQTYRRTAVCADL